MLTAIYGIFIVLGVCISSSSIYSVLCGFMALPAGHYINFFLIFKSRSWHYKIR